MLSGNRNFEGRVNRRMCRANYLASPPLVVAYALAGIVTKDLTSPQSRSATDNDGNPVFLKDIWPSSAQEIQPFIVRNERHPRRLFRNQAMADVFKGDDKWRAMSKFPSGLDLWLVRQRFDLCSEPALF